ncbi:MAG: response regulator, partial [Alistipes sp.]|nr:response regulator [Alistipes sp.]
HDYANFRVEFSALNFAVQHAVRYMYKLEGYDRDWNVSGAVNRASYSNVPAGRYTLHVRAFAGHAETADSGIRLGVDILPPPWLSWWAKVLYVLAALVVAGVMFRIFGSVVRMRRAASVERDMTDLKLRFFTDISHELRTPLTLILGGIEDVQRHDRLSARAENSLTLAHRNAKRMLTLINQLLDFRKIVKEKMELKISRVDLVPVVEDALDDFREMASERRIELLFTVSRRSILVWVDPERIESVIYNLLSNALKFTPSGGQIEVILSVREAEECVVLVVRDTGIGIPRDKIGHIFERFVQASRAVDSSMKGSGIGLSLCREIVALHHGEISVSSAPGEGSVFTVKLRMGNAHFGMEQIDFSGAGSDGKAAYMVSDFTSVDSQRRTDVSPPAEAQKILLVEDNRELRVFIYNSLIDTYRVIEADDGVEALEKIRSDMPDIIVTDLMMPRMDGIELIDRVRHDFTMSHIPIVMLTARHSPDDRLKAMEFGADGYITKPFSIELLLARIDNLLTRRRTLFEKFSAQSARNKVAELVVEDVVVTDRDEEFMKEVMSWLGKNIENSDLTIDQLASHLGLGRTTMYNKLKSLTGKSPVELLKEYRITKAKLLLRTGQFSVSEVAYKVGFSDPGYFSRCFREQFHMSPAEYLKT